MDSSTPKGSKEDWKGQIAATKTPKDKSCPYCGQAFTSSSLGRHLDLYIREKNPKPPDGIHDVDAIRRLRENITRRQPRGAVRRETSTPAATPTIHAKKSPSPSEAGDESTPKSPANPKEGSQFREGIGRQFPFHTPWEATGVILNIPELSGGEHGTAEEPSGEAGCSTAGAAGSNNGRARTMLPVQRSTSRQAMKAQLDMKQKLQEALDKAKAAELALKEILSSWRAAKQQFDMNSMPFDFDPLALDFPALTLQCLQPPPTLFSSTQYPTATSWSILPPGKRQYEALRSWFVDEFRKWGISCQAATTALTEDLTYPPSQSAFKPKELREAVHRAEKIVDSLEAQVNEHIETMFGVWDLLPPERQNELWTLELARAVGRKQKDTEELKESQHRLKQENANLKSQIEHLNRLQQPREYKLMPPMTLPMDQKLLAFMQEFGVSQKKQHVGFSMEGRHSDLNTIITSAIDRWKNVISTARSVGGLNAQRALDTTDLVKNKTKPADPSSSPSSINAASSEGQAQVQQDKQPTHSLPPAQSALQPYLVPIAGKGSFTELHTASARDTQVNTEAPPPPASTTKTVSPPTSESAEVSDDHNDKGDEQEREEDGEGESEDEDDEMSDADADADADGDAEMDVDDGFSSMNPPGGVSTPMSTITTQHLPQEQLQHHANNTAPVSALGRDPLEFGRTRAAQSRFAVNGVPGVRSETHSGAQGSRGARGGMSMTKRSLTNMQAVQHALQNHHSPAQPAQTGLSMIQGVGDPMYME